MPNCRAFSAFPDIGAISRRVFLVTLSPTASPAAAASRHPSSRDVVVAPVRTTRSPDWSRPSPGAARTSPAAAVGRPSRTATRRPGPGRAGRDRSRRGAGRPRQPVDGAGQEVRLPLLRPATGHGRRGAGRGGQTSQACSTVTGRRPRADGGRAGRAAARASCNAERARRGGRPAAAWPARRLRPATGRKCRASRIVHSPRSPVRDMVRPSRPNAAARTGASKARPRSGRPGARPPHRPGRRRRAPGRGEAAGRQQPLVAGPGDDRATEQATIDVGEARPVGVADPGG